SHHLIGPPAARPSRASRLRPTGLARRILLMKAQRAVCCREADRSQPNNTHVYARLNAVVTNHRGLGVVDRQVIEPDHLIDGDTTSSTAGLDPGALKLPRLPSPRGALVDQCSRALASHCATSPPGRRRGDASRATFGSDP